MWNRHVNLSIHPPTIYDCLSYVESQGGLEPIPADSEREVGYHKVSHVNVRQHAVSILNVAIQFHLNILHIWVKLLFDY